MAAPSHSVDSMSQWLNGSWDATIQVIVWLSRDNSGWQDKLIEHFGNQPWQYFDSTHTGIVRALMAGNDATVAQRMTPEEHKTWQKIIQKYSPLHCTPQRWSEWERAIREGHLARHLRFAPQPDMKPSEYLQARIIRDEQLLDGKAKEVDLTSKQISHDFLVDYKSKQDKGLSPGLTTFFPELDEMLGAGLEGFVKLGGAPGTYKSMLAQWWAYQHAQKLHEEKQPGQILIVAGDMSVSDWQRRAISWQTGIDSRDIHACKTPYSQIKEATDKLEQLPITYYPRGELITTESILQFLKRQHRKHGTIPLLIIDHEESINIRQQLKDKMGTMESFEYTIAQVFKEYAKTILVLQHLNRDLMARSVPLPRNSDLRYTGDQNPDLILFTLVPYSLRDFSDKIKEDICHRWRLHVLDDLMVRQNSHDAEDAQKARQAILDIRQHFILAVTKNRDGISDFRFGDVQPGTPGAIRAQPAICQFAQTEGKKTNLDVI